ncbi:MAG TPA: hypothetical protein PKI03_29395 [Pseudomonadota bacterium]|nr:hypothetical protein [Pseudomonadota bacterium]
MREHNITNGGQGGVSRRRLLQGGLGGLAVWALGPVFGCGALRFDISQSVPEQRIMGSVLGALLGSFIPTPFSLNINLAQETQARGTGPAQSAGLKALSFRLTNVPNPPRSSDNFDFVDRIEIFVESTKSGTSLTKQKVADLLTVPRGVQTLSLQCYPNVDLVPYINEGARISSTAAGKVPPQDVTFDGQITIEVRV